MADGWEIIKTPTGTFLVSKFGERLPINPAVREALVRKGLVRPSSEEAGRTTILKTCVRCGRSFPATREYFYVYGRERNGLKAWCKGCCAECDRKRGQANRDHRMRRRQDRIRILNELWSRWAWVAQDAMKEASA